MRVPMTSTLMTWVITVVYVTYTSSRRYDGYKVVSVYQNTEDHLSALQNLQTQKIDSLDFWVFPQHVPSHVTFAVSGDQYTDVVSSLKADGLQVTTVHQNLQSLVDEERRNMSMATRAGEGAYNFRQYQSHRKMNRYLARLAGKCSFCEVLNIGTSFEGRDMQVLKIGGQRNNKPAIWIDAGIHAREWIAPATAMYIVHKFEEGLQSNDSVVLGLVADYDWYILPSVNPDGYQYSRRQERLWRKTRKPRQSSQSWPDCVGVDPNRNWDFHWMETGASSWPCSNIFAGDEAFSEPETSAVRDFLLTETREWQAYVTIHAYGQYWLCPWGYTSALPDDYEDLMHVAGLGASALHDVNGKEFTMGTSTNVLYAAAGGSDDWAKGVAGIKYSYTLELRDTGSYGFILPADQIEAVGEEVWAAMVAMATAIWEREGLSN